MRWNYRIEQNLIRAKYAFEAKALHPDSGTRCISPSGRVSWPICLYNEAEHQRQCCRYHLTNGNKPGGKRGMFWGLDALCCRYHRGLPRWWHVLKEISRLSCFSCQGDTFRRMCHFRSKYRFESIARDFWLYDGEFKFLLLKLLFFIQYYQKKYTLLFNGNSTHILNINFQINYVPEVHYINS